MWFYCRLDAARSERACGKDAAKMRQRCSLISQEISSINFQCFITHINFQLIQFIVLLVMLTQINTSSYKDWHSIVINVLID